MADVNGDSIADLIALNYNSDGCETTNTTEGTVSILLATPTGHSNQRLPPIRADFARQLSSSGISMVMAIRT